MLVRNWIEAPYFASIRCRSSGVSVTLVPHDEGSTRGLNRSQLATPDISIPSN